MTRYKHRWTLVGLAVLASAAAYMVTAIPAGATLVCPRGVTNPKYCTDYKPTANTGVAKPVGPTTATLRGVAGPSIANGDLTTFRFQWGSDTSYGNTTPPGTIGQCQAGHTTAPYCTGPARKAVSATIRGLQPCTTYHFRIVARNPDGTTRGDDATFATRFGPRPITLVKSPRQVRAFTTFTVHVALRFAANVTIQIRQGGAALKTYPLGQQSPGLIATQVSAPGRAGDYYVRVIADEGCGTQTVNKKLRVIRQR